MIANETERKNASVHIDYSLPTDALQQFVMRFFISASL